MLVGYYAYLQQQYRHDFCRNLFELCMDYGFYLRANNIIHFNSMRSDILERYPPLKSKLSHNM